MSAYLYDASTCMTSAYLLAYLYYVCSTLWWIPTCSDVCLPVLCLLTCIMPAYMYSICCTVWCPPTFMTPAYLYDICLPVLCLPTCSMYAQLNNLCLAVWCLLTCICLDSCPDDIWLPVSPVVVSSIFVFPSHKNNAYMLSKVYCYFVLERTFLAVRRVSLMTRRVDRPFPVTWLDNVWEPTTPPPQYGLEPTI